MNYLSSRFKLLSITFIILAVTVISVLFLLNKNDSQQSEASDNAIQNELQRNEGIAKLPSPVFTNWIEESSSSATISTNNEADIYGLKRFFSTEEMKDLAQIFAVNSNLEESASTASFVEYNPNGGEVLMFNKQTPSFFYTSTEGVTITGDIRSGATNFINKLGIFDKSIQITATYQRISEPGIIYYEFHRNWDAFGLPIFNPFGLLNIPEEQSLKSISYTSGNAQLDIDADIYNTSDNKDGFRREQDFNTLVVAVDQNRNRIVKVESNIRPIETEITLAEQNPLLTKDQAIENLRNGNHSLFFTLPSGDGVLDLDKVYPENIASGENAIIQESLLTYLEKPAGVLQTSMEPYYIFKGYSNLDSGFRVRFIAIVSAIANENISVTFNKQSTPNVAGVKTVAQGIGGQQQDTLSFPTSQPQTTTPTLTDPTPTTLITQMPTTVVSTTPQPTSAPEICSDPDAPVILKTFEHEGITFALGVDPIEYKTYSFYFFPTQEWKNNIADQRDVLKKLVDYIQNVSNEFVVHIPEDWKINSDTRNTIQTKFDNAERNKDNFFLSKNTYDFSKMDYVEDSSQLCPIRITGRSPSMFIYGPQNTQLSISIQSKLTYADPQLIHNNWNVLIQSDNRLLVNNTNRKFLYYEYETIDFNKPETGWIITKNQLKSLSSELAMGLQLNSLESERLLFELKSEASKVTDNFIFVGIIPQSEVNSKLPLTVLPQVSNIQRFHFYVQGVPNKMKVKQPKILPIIRSETMILEFGVTGTK